MSDMVNRRKFIRTGLLAAGSASGLAAAAGLARRYGLIPPDHGTLFGVGETLTYAAQRILMSHHPLAREFSRSEISKVAIVNGDPPDIELYHRLLAGKFAEWRLPIDGLVARPGSFSLAELKHFPARSQITLHVCEQGWSFIAEWIGVPLSYVLNLVGVSTQARYVVFFTFDGGHESIDMADAWHPQTLLAYGMNGGDLPTGNGAPVRLRVARQLGYKSLKFLTRIVVVDSVKNIGKGLGGSNSEDGFGWYAGI